MHIFISYAKKDTFELADRLYRQLNSLDGVTAWMDRDLRPSLDWSLQIQNQIDNCDEMIVLLSPDVNRKKTDDVDISFVMKEIHYARRTGKPITPIMAEDTSPPLVLEGIEYIDFARDPNMGMERLLAEIREKISIPIGENKSNDTIRQNESVNDIGKSKPKQSFFISFPYSILLSITVVIIVILILVSQNGQPNNNNSLSTLDDLTATSNNVADVATKPNQETEVIITASATKTSTVTLAPTDTKDAEAIAQSIVLTLNQESTLTQIAQETATAILWTQTPTPDVTRTVSVVLTRWAGETATQESSNATSTATLWTLTPSLTPSSTPTVTPSLTKTKTPLEIAIERAIAGVQSNEEWDEWYPNGFTYEFDGVEMVLVPSGQFIMGSTDDEIEYAVAICDESRIDEGNCARESFENELSLQVNNQEILKPFWIDKYEVSNSLYGEVGCADWSEAPNEPRNCVNWFDANAFCEGRGGRLPTEAEWEYAARGPDRLIFPWGNTYEGNEANHCDTGCSQQPWASDLRYMNEEHDDEYTIVSPVTAYSDNQSWVGAQNLAGNVWEWVSSVYWDYPYDASYEELSDENDRHIVRGGSFGDSMNSLRSTDRNDWLPNNRSQYVGFRCVRDFDG